MKNLIGFCLILFFSMNLAVFAETSENDNFETENTDTFDNLSQAKRNAISTKSFMLDTVLSNKNVTGRRAKAGDLPRNKRRNNSKLRKRKPDFTGRVKPLSEEMDENRENGKRKPNGKRDKFGNNTSVKKPTKVPVKISKNKSNESSFFARKGVVISEKLAQIVGVIASEYKRLTGDPIIISSGTRSPQRQAVAMLGRIDKLGEKGVQKLYKNKTAVKQILDAYRQHRNNRPMAIKAMAKVIEEQVAQKVYISRHLKAVPLI